MDARLLMRMARIARTRPSRRMVAVVAFVLALAAGLAAVEAIWSWPEALTPERAGRMPGLSTRF